MAQARGLACRSPTSLKYASRAGGGLCAGFGPHPLTYFFFAPNSRRARREGLHLISLFITISYYAIYMNLCSIQEFHFKMILGQYQRQFCAS